MNLKYRGTLEIYCQRCAWRGSNTSLGYLQAMGFRLHTVFEGYQGWGTEKIALLKMHQSTERMPPLQWRLYERDGTPNHQHRHCLLKRLYKAQIKENIKAPRYWPLWGEFTGDRWILRTKDQYAENVFIWWRHHNKEKREVSWTQVCD